MFNTEVCYNATLIRFCPVQVYCAVKVMLFANEVDGRGRLIKLDFVLSHMRMLPLHTIHGHSQPD